MSVSIILSRVLDTVKQLIVNGIYGNCPEFQQRFPKYLLILPSKIN